GPRPRDRAPDRGQCAACGAGEQAPDRRRPAAHARRHARDPGRGALRRDRGREGGTGLVPRAPAPALPGPLNALPGPAEGDEMPRILLTHADEARAQYYGEEALARLRDLGEVRLNESGRPMSTPELIALARDCQIIVSDRTAEGPAAVFEQLPELVAFVRCAVDIRHVDVGAASANGVLVTRASPGFID